MFFLISAGYDGEKRNKKRVSNLEREMLTQE
jgi:hypothetical protein